MKIWMSPQTQRKNHYAASTLGGIVAIVLLAMLVSVGGVMLSFYFDWPREISAAVLLVVVTALIFWLALRLGRRSVQNALVFFLDDANRLFAVDARQLVYQSSSLLRQAEATVEVQQRLECIRGQGALPEGALEIRKVLQIKERRHDYTLVCLVRYPGGKSGRHTLFLVKGIPGQMQLLQQLERRQQGSGSVELPPDYNLRALAVCLPLTLVGMIVCVLSHPTLGQLPQGVYFPALALTAVGILFCIYFIVKRRRGE